MTLLKTLRRSAALAILCAAGAAHANQFGIFDPRSVAMGGTGVASGTAGNASYFNPALLAAPSPNDKFAIEIPIVAARAADPNKLRDDVDNLKTSGDTLSNAINQFNAVLPSGCSAQRQYFADSGRGGASGNRAWRIPRPADDGQQQGT